MAGWVVGCLLFFQGLPHNGFLLQEWSLQEDWFLLPLDWEYWQNQK